MEHLLDTIKDIRMTGGYIAPCGCHAAYLVRPGKKKSCFKRNRLLWREPP
tara:strand:+ start:192 stop:341 length:150 start_codon:yes stop_codon:yes gene_type:complete